MDATQEQPATVVTEGFATVTEAASYLNLSRSKLYLEMDEGRLAYARFGRSRRIPWRSLWDYAEAAMVACQPVTNL